jgi:hypothetical protein
MIDYGALDRIEGSESNYLMFYANAGSTETLYIAVKLYDNASTLLETRSYTIDLSGVTTVSNITSITEAPMVNQATGESVAPSDYDASEAGGVITITATGVPYPRTQAAQARTGRARRWSWRQCA